MCADCNAGLTSGFTCETWCLWGSPHPLENLPPHMSFPLTFSSNQFQFSSIPQNSGGRRNYTKIPLSNSNSKGKHVETYLLLSILLEIKPEQNTQRNYPKNEDIKKVTSSIRL